MSSAEICRENLIVLTESAVEADGIRSPESPIALPNMDTWTERASSMARKPFQYKLRDDYNIPESDGNAVLATDSGADSC
jgi:hypothetical protein